MELATVTFEDWLNLQKLLKSERLQLESDEAEKVKLLATLKGMHLDYYRVQLGVRQERDKNGFRRVLVDSPGLVLSNAASYVERLLYFIRTTPHAFALMLDCIPLKNPQLDLLLETIMFSFFEDLVNTETTEIDLLMRLKELVQKEVGSTKHCSELFSESSPNITGKLLILYTQRRSQRRFIKLMLKQTLIRIINTDDMTIHLDSRRIYREVKKKRKQFYANTLTVYSKFNADVVTEQHSDDEDKDSLANLDEEVNVILTQMSETLQHYCLFLLDSVYNSLEKMPFAMRWLCRIVSTSILSRPERNTVKDRNITLGAWVFTKWILVSVQSADLNGLLSDTQVTETNIANFGLIGRVIRHVYEEARFEDEQFESLNQFILKEIPRMRQFFNDLVDVKDALQPLIPQPFIEMPEVVEEEPEDFHKIPGSMTYYYQNNIERSKPTIPSVPLHPHNEIIAKLKFQTVVLSTVDIATIVQSITTHKALFLSHSHHSILKMAEKAKSALSEDESFGNANPGALLQYIMFIQELMPREMEDNYLTQLHVSRVSTMREQRSIASRVKDVTRRMLLAVDSFAAFVSRSATCSLADIADFLIDFSYMYKHSTDKKGVQTELLARFLKAHLCQLPEEYRVGNFRKLFNELFLEYRRKHVLKRTSADRNLQTLLMATHMMEKHLSDIRSEDKLITAFKRSNDFFSFILKERIPVSIRRVRSLGGAHLLQVARAQSIRSSRLYDLTSMTVYTVLDFAKEFCTYEEVQRATEFEEDVGNAREAFSQYLAIVRQKLEEHPQYSRRTPEEVDFVFEDIAKYMTRRMNKELFPPWASKADLCMHQRCQELDWTTPEDLRLDLTVPNLMVDEAIQGLRDVDEFLSPQSKLGKMVEAVSLILNEAEFGVTLENLEKPEGALPYIMYLLIKTCPARFWSNMNFIAKFWHPRQTEKQPWLCFTLLKSAARIIEAADATTFQMKKDAYSRRTEASRAAHL